MAPARSCSSRTIASILFRTRKPERQPGVDAGRLLADHAGAQHQAVRDDLRLFRRLAQDRQEITAKAHRLSE